MHHTYWLIVQQISPRSRSIIKVFTTKNYAMHIWWYWFRRNQRVLDLRSNQRAMVRVHVSRCKALDLSSICRQSRLEVPERIHCGFNEDAERRIQLLQRADHQRCSYCDSVPVGERKPRVLLQTGNEWNFSYDSDCFCYRKSGTLPGVLVSGAGRFKRYDRDFWLKRDRARFSSRISAWSSIYVSWCFYGFRSHTQNGHSRLIHGHKGYYKSKVRIAKQKQFWASEIVVFCAWSW